MFLFRPVSIYLVFFLFFSDSRVLSYQPLAAVYVLDWARASSAIRQLVYPTVASAFNRPRGLLPLAKWSTTSPLTGNT